MTYDTVLFDNDGVLVGRTRYDVLEAAIEDTFTQFGITAPDAKHIKDMTIGATPARVETVCGTYGIDPHDFFQARDHTLAEAQQAEARAGRKTPYEDVEELADLDAELGIVSSNQQATVDFLIEHFGVADLFGTAYGREATIESLSRRKPDPHYLDRALADLDAESALFIGDNESDITAADNAGIDSAFIRRPHRQEWELEVWPTWDIDSLADLHEICGS